MYMIFCNDIFELCETTIMYNELHISVLYYMYWSNWSLSQICKYAELLTQTWTILYTTTATGLRTSVVCCSWLISGVIPNLLAVIIPCVIHTPLRSAQWQNVKKLTWILLLFYCYILSANPVKISKQIWWSCDQNFFLSQWQRFM